MDSDIGKKYDKIAKWWHENHVNSSYGLEQIERAIRYCKHKDSALDVGCGSGGRIIRKLIQENFTVYGIDASAEMIAIAQSEHKDINLTNCNIIGWESDQKFDLIIAWDSIFHLPMTMQKPVIAKLCRMLKNSGILIYTFGDTIDEHESEWHGDHFPYSSIGINGNLKTIMESGCECIHLELDQYPENHVNIIAQKR
ncbi:MAG: class I SAM-dependent methyltransferase [Daejeonella sp.]|nr:class I SAM-dependent methyltransferase [Daejeonella sp.]